MSQIKVERDPGQDRLREQGVASQHLTVMLNVETRPRHCATPSLCDPVIVRPRHCEQL